MAIEHGHFECANLLIELCSLSAEPRPFHEAIAQGQAKATAFMLAREPSLIDTIDPAKLILDAENNDHGDMVAAFVHDRKSRPILLSLGSLQTLRGRSTPLMGRSARKLLAGWSHARFCISDDENWRAR